MSRQPIRRDPGRPAGERPAAAPEPACWRCCRAAPTPSACCTRSRECSAPRRVDALHVTTACGRRRTRTSASAGAVRGLGVELHVERVSDPGAREHSRRWRGRRATRRPRRVAARAGLDLVATGHTASDQVETVLYRLATSPGRRALLGMAPRRDRIVRPLLAVSGEDTRAYCREAGLPLARGRVQPGPPLGAKPPAARRDPCAARDPSGGRGKCARDRGPAARRAGGARAGGGRGAPAHRRGRQPPAVEAARLAASRPRCGGCCSGAWRSRPPGRPCRCAAERMREIERLAERGGSGVAGARRRRASGRGIWRGPVPARTRRRGAGPAALPVPGACRFGAWEVRAEPGRFPPAGDLGSLDEPLLDAAGSASR